MFSKETNLEGLVMGGNTNYRKKNGRRAKFRSGDPFQRERRRAADGWRERPIGKKGEDLVKRTGVSRTKSARNVWMQRISSILLLSILVSCFFLLCGLLMN